MCIDGLNALYRLVVSIGWRRRSHCRCSSARSTRWCRRRSRRRRRCYHHYHHRPQLSDLLANGFSNVL